MDEEALMLKQAFLDLVDECGKRQYRFSISWSEAEGCFYSEASGLGQGEFVEVKRRSTPLAAATALLDLVRDIQP
jgi:hypothetical protein